MKKLIFIAYTFAVLMVGVLFGGDLKAWAIGQAARVGFGPYQVGMYFEHENSVLVQIYAPKTIKRVRSAGPDRVYLELK